MYQFNGSLEVRKIHGRYGTFAIGTIKSPIGDFSIKQAELDEFEEGIYQGEFVISSIQAISSNFGANKLILESRAILASINISEAEETEIPADQEADPIEKVVIVAPVEDVPAYEAKVKEVAELGTDADLDEQLNAVFDDKALVASFNDKVQIKLDPTDRVALRKQADFLKTNNYKYDATSKTWNHTKNS